MFWVVVLEVLFINWVKHNGWDLMCCFLVSGICAGDESRINWRISFAHFGSISRLNSNSRIRVWWNTWTGSITLTLNPNFFPLLVFHFALITQQKRQKTVFILGTQNLQAKNPHDWMHSGAMNGGRGWCGAGTRGGSGGCWGASRLLCDASHHCLGWFSSSRPLRFVRSQCYCPRWHSNSWPQPPWHWSHHWWANQVHTTYSYRLTPPWVGHLHLYR